jgi:hypothetical protein
MLSRTAIIYILISVFAFGPLNWESNPLASELGLRDLVAFISYRRAPLTLDDSAGSTNLPVLSWSI